MSGAAPGRTPADLHAVQMIDSLGTGGAEKMVLLLARQCEKAGVHFTVISLAADGDSEIARGIRAVNGRVCNFPADKLLDLRRIRSLAGFLRREQFNLVHAYLTYANIVGSMAGALAGIPVICSLRNVDDAPEYFHPGRRFLETLCLNLLASRVMGNGYAIARAHSGRVRTRPIDVIPNATVVPERITAGEQAALRRDLAGDETRPIVVSTGRLIHQKGYPDLIDAAARVREKIPSVLFVIAGEGTDREELEKQIASLDLSGNVRLLGYRGDIPRLLQAGDVFVSPSLFEGMSVAILEAMAAGLPVVATDVGDASRVIDETNGILVPRGNPGLIADSILAILKDRRAGASMGSAGRKRVIEHFSPEAWVNKIFCLYEKTIRR